MSFTRGENELPKSYDCLFIAVSDDRYLIFGEPHQELTRDEAEEYTRLTNRLAAQNRELQQLRREAVVRNQELSDSLEALKQERARVKVLSGMLPICASCKKIQDDDGYWEQLESFIDRHSEAVFSHGLCPSCAKELYPDLESNL